MYLMPEGKKMFGWQILFVKIFVNFFVSSVVFFSVCSYKKWKILRQILCFTL